MVLSKLVSVIAFWVVRAMLAPHLGKVARAAREFLTKANMLTLFSATFFCRDESLYSYESAK